MIEEKADAMLEKWAREMRDGRPGMFPATALDGNLALTETANYRSGKRGRQASGKESKRVARTEIVVSAETEEIERIMVSVAAVCPECYQALKLSYQVTTMREVQRIMRISYAAARTARATGFKMVCAALMTKRRDYDYR